VKVAVAVALKHALELIEELGPESVFLWRWYFALMLSEPV
jgi:hypothetical protein